MTSSILKRPRRNSPWLALAIALILAIACGSVKFGEPLEDLWRGARNYIRLRPADGRTVIVGIDEKTYAALKTEVYPVTIDARVLDSLYRAGAKRVYFDRTFSNATDPQSDKEFASALTRHPTTTYLGQVSVTDTKTGQRVDIAPFPGFAKSARIASLIGHATPFQLSAMLPYAARTNGAVIPSISASIAGATGPAVDTGDESDMLYRPDWSIDLSSIPTVSFIDVAEGNFSPHLFKGKDIIVGPTSTRSHDMQRIAGQGWYPGVYFHAAGAQTLTEGRPRDLGWIPPLLFAAAIAAALLSTKRPGSRGKTIAAGYFALAAVPFVTDAALIEIDYIPGVLLLTIIAWRSATMTAIHNTKTRNDQTGLATLAGLAQSEIAKHRPIVAMQISNFAAIAASFNDDIEDELTKAIAERITATEADTVVYQGDKQLCWYGPDVTTKQLEDHLKGLARIIGTSIKINGRLLDIRLAFGIDNSRDRPLKTRIASAQMAADQAATANLVVSTYNQAPTDAAWQLAMIGEMETAIGSGHIWVAYQPKLDIRSGLICGVEALVRWQHPDRGNIPPDEFIAAAESANRIEQLTHHVLSTAMTSLRPLALANASFSLAINISPSILNQLDDFASYIREIALTCRYPLTGLTLEITETAVINDIERAKASLIALACDGVTISIDDYGTGQSSLSYMRSFPAQELKIDQSFVKDLASNPRDALVVKSTIELAHALKRRVVAEGVENQETLEHLKAFECDVAQGGSVAKIGGSHR